MVKQISLIALFVLLTGCGGGGSGGGSPQGPTPGGVTLNISWPARTRDASAPASATSVLLTLHATGQSDVSAKYDRPSTQLAAYSSALQAGQLTPASYQATLNFYASPGETGAIVATAQFPIEVASGSTATVPAVTLSQSVASVVVNAPSDLFLGKTQQLSFTASDANGATVAVSPGSATWSVVQGGSAGSVSKDGILSASNVGAGTITATVDGVTSLEHLFAVDSGPSSALAPASFVPVETHAFATQNLVSAVVGADGNSYAVTRLLAMKSADGTHMLEYGYRDATGNIAGVTQVAIWGSDPSKANILEFDINGNLTAAVDGATGTRLGVTFGTNTATFNMSDKSGNSLYSYAVTQNGSNYSLGPAVQSMIRHAHATKLARVKTAKAAKGTKVKPALDDDDTTPDGDGDESVFDQFLTNAQGFINSFNSNWQNIAVTYQSSLMSKFGAGILGYAALVGGAEYFVAGSAWAAFAVASPYIIIGGTLIAASYYWYYYGSAATKQLNTDINSVIQDDGGSNWNQVPFDYGN